MPVTFEKRRFTGFLKATVAKTSANCAAASAISGEWNGPATLSRINLRQPASLQSSSAFSKPSAVPEITVCFGLLRLAGNAFCCDVSGCRAASTCSGVSPITAAMPGLLPAEAAERASHAFCMIFPRSLTMQIVSSNERTFAVHSAANSPNENPAQISGSTPRNSRSFTTAREAVVIASWLLSLRASSSSSVCHIYSETGSSAISSASFTTFIATGYFSQISRNIPFFCAPWPGNKNTFFINLL